MFLTHRYTVRKALRDIVDVTEADLGQIGEVNLSQMPHLYDGAHELLDRSRVAARRVIAKDRHIVPNTPWKTDGKLCLRYGIGVFSACLALLLPLPLWIVFGTANPYITVYLAIILSEWHG